jgi:hypothetical protein
VKGTLIECPKHNGRFDFTDGSPQRKPACVALQTFQAKEQDGKIFLQLTAMGENREGLPDDENAVARQPDAAAAAYPFPVPRSTLPHEPRTRSLSPSDG